MTSFEAEARLATIEAMPFRPASRRGHLVRGAAESALELWRHRELVVLLSRREIRARYKDSSLGIVWSLVRPLAQLLIYYFAIGKVLQVERGIPDFAIFVFVGLTGWTLYTEIVVKAATSIIHNAGLVKKVYLPREVFPLSSVGSALFGLGIQLVVLAGAIAVFGALPTPIGALYAVMSIAVLVVFGTALGVLLSALTVYFRDIEHLLEVAFVVLFWASPIVYSYTFVHKYFEGNWVADVYAANPVTLAILGLQNGLWAPGLPEGFEGAVWPDHLGLSLGIALIASFGFLWIAQLVFSRLQGDFAQEV